MLVVGKTLIVLGAILAVLFIVMLVIAGFVVGDRFDAVDLQWIIAQTDSHNPDLFPESQFSDNQTNKSAFVGCLIIYVDQTLKFSNLLEDLKKVERFAQYIENQGIENLTEMEGSQK